jgi:hypothetical protein
VTYFDVERQPAEWNGVTIKIMAGKFYFLTNIKQLNRSGKQIKSDLMFNAYFFQSSPNVPGNKVEYLLDILS